MGELENQSGLDAGEGDFTENTPQNAPSVEIDLIQLCQKLSENFHGMLLSEDHASSVILRSMLATMAVAKGKNDEAELILHDAMEAFESWEIRRLKLWNDAVEADQSMLEILAKRSNIQDAELDKYRKRLENLKNRIDRSSGDGNGG